MKAITASLLAVLALPAGLQAQQDPLTHVSAERARLSPAALAGATALLQDAVDRGLIAGAVAAIARDGQLGYLEAVGFQDLEHGVPMTTQSLFRIYSMTKAVTAVGVMMLHEEGKFGLDDPVADYLPDFARVRVADEAAGSLRPPARPITVRDLLLHTAGLSHRSSQLYQEADVRRRSDDLSTFVSRIVGPPLMEDPGTRFRYSEGTTVLGRLIEVWSGHPLDHFMSERIFTPLGMSETHFWVDPERAPRLATMYRSSDGGPLTPYEIEEVPFTDRAAMQEGAVGLVSTVPDFLRFSQMLLDGGVLAGTRLLRTETVREITANGLSPDVLASRGGSMGWGLANVNVLVDASRLDDPANVGEFGWDGSAGTIFWVDPVDRTVILLMTQNAPANPESLRQRFKRAATGALMR